MAIGFVVPSPSLSLFAFVLFFFSHTPIEISKGGVEGE
jgi:hypothetical protein